MKCIMLSVHPKWCELIASGKKTIEVRKTAPKLETPFKCYIYCTKQKRKSDFITKSENFGCITGYENSFYNRDKTLDCNGKVISEFVCDSIEKYEYSTIDGVDIDDDNLLETMLEWEGINIYGKGKPLYGWHISDLKIYDKPKELGDFRRVCKQYGAENPFCDDCKYFIEYRTHEYDESDCAYGGNPPLTRPFQSWGYVAQMKEN